MKKYFSGIKEDVLKSYAIANESKKRGIDPDKEVCIILTENMAERVEGLISVAAPQIKDSGLVEGIMELEKKYSMQDWRVAFYIAERVAKEEFCKFKDDCEAALFCLSKEDKFCVAEEIALLALFVEDAVCVFDLLRDSNELLADSVD